jgi:hypothetical protein
MWKIIKVLVWIFIMLFISPILKDWYDVYTTPATGVAVGVVDDTVLAIMTFVPWYLPLVFALGILLYLVRPEPPPTPSYPTFRIPQQPKQKKKPPMM